MTPAPPPVPAPSGGLDVATLSSALLEIVSEKTGYPTEMLELEMDIEADLGIDSIKRVEILGAMRDQFPELPQLKAEDLGELRTLEEIVTYMRDHSGSANGNGATTQAVATPAPVQTPVTPVGATPESPERTPVVTPAPATGGGVEVTTLSSALLEIVSEKTGYPTEMLELETDTEADPGIDSLKRVDILGAMRDQFPELPQLKAEDLGELRTLEEIVSYMRDHSGSANGNGATTQAVATPAPVQTPVTPVGATHESPEPTPVAAPATGGGLDVATLSNALLEIVSEKTGYPTEMLELEMDIEADLGIDSIKRVEILGAMRDQFPELPQLKAEDLGELRTLEEIVTYMRDHSGSANGNGASKSPAVESEVALPKVDANGGAGRSSLAKIDHDIPRSAAQWTFLPTPDIFERPFANDGVVLITDDGSPLTAKVVEKLAQQNAKTVVLSFPSDVVASQSDLPDGALRVTLPDMTEAQLQSALESISQDHGEIAAILDFYPTAQTKGSLVHDQEK
jgi:acyl carrier protein